MRPLEYIVKTHHGRPSKVLGRPCMRCKKLIVEGAEVVTKQNGRRVYHLTCWESLLID